MATKREMLDEFTVEGLNELAEQHGVEFSSDDESVMKDELAAALTVADIEAYSAEVDAEEAAPSAPAVSGSLDPMLVDPEAQAVAAAEGTVNDASTRAEGTSVEDLEPAPSQDAKPTDEEGYDFPPAGDVEIATAEAGDGEGESLAPLEVEDWVILGEHELVPDRLVGRRAVVLEAPRGLTPVEEADDLWITVRTRDEVNATLVIPLAAVAEVQKGGLAVTHR